MLTAMGQDPKLGALRISTGHATTEDDIEKAVEASARLQGGASCPVRQPEGWE